MKSIQQKIQETLFLIILILFSATALHAQSSSTTSEEAPTFLYDLKFEEESLESALFQILFSQSRFTIVGSDEVVVNVEIKARTEEDAIDQLAQQMDWLVTRRGTRYFIYVEDAEEELRGRPINYMFKCRSVRSGDILQILEGKSPVGFPQPKQLEANNSGGSQSGYGGYSGSSSDGYPGGFSASPDGISGFGGNPTDPSGNGPAGIDFPDDSSPLPQTPAMPSPRGGPPGPIPGLPPTSRRSNGQRATVRKAGYTQKGGLPGGLQQPPENFNGIPESDVAMPESADDGGDSPLAFKPGRGLQLPLGQVQYDSIPNLNTIMIRGQLSDVRTAVEFLQTIDQPVPVVLVELLIVKFVHGDDFTWRYDVFNGQIAKGDAPSVTPNGTSLPLTTDFGERAFGINAEGVGISATDGGGPLAFTAVGNLTASFRQNLKFLISKKQARIVTNPHIAVVSGNEGRIELNEEFNYQTSLVFPRCWSSGMRP